MLFNDPIGYAGELSSEFGPQPIGLHVKDSHMDRLFAYFCRQYSKRQKMFDEVGAVKIVPSAKWVKSNKGDTSTLADVDVPLLSQRSIVTKTGGIFVLPKQLSARPLKAVARKSLARPKDFPSNMQDVPDYIWKCLATGKMQAEYATSFEVDPTLCKKLDLMSFRGILGALKQHEDVRTIFGFFGTYGSVFCFHTEDFEALSVNILLDGAPKIMEELKNFKLNDLYRQLFLSDEQFVEWLQKLSEDAFHFRIRTYVENEAILTFAAIQQTVHQTKRYWIVIAAEHRDNFNHLTAKLYSQEKTRCEKPTSHLNFLVSPAQLQAADIPYTEFIQYPGEIMVIMAGAHHAGFNLGVNYSENVYCGHPSMLEQLKKTNNLCCDCKEDDGKTRKHLPLNRSELDKLEEAARHFNTNVAASMRSKEQKKMSKASIRQPIVIPDPPKSVKVVLEVCQTPIRTPTSSLKRPFTPGQTASTKRVTIIEPNPFAKSTPFKRKSTRNIVELVAEFNNAERGGKPIQNPFLAKKRKMGNTTKERLTKSEPRNNGNRTAPIHRKDSGQDSEKENYFAEKRPGHGTSFLSLDSTLGPRISSSQGTTGAASDYWAD